MATGHLNPGYGNSVSQMSNAGYAIDYNVPIGTNSMREMHNVSMNRDTLDDIRRQAREAWTMKGTPQTSYQDHFSDKHSQVGEFTTTRPTSAGRKNKPHPPMVFLTNRLHYCPGYHNAKTTLGQDPYQIDMSVSPGHQHQRAKLKSKFVGRPASVALNQYKTDIEEFQFSENPLQRKVAQALLGCTNDENVLGPHKDITYDGIQIRGAMERSYRPMTQPSLHRYLKHAGAQELSNLNLRSQSAHYDPPDYNRNVYNFGAALDDIDSRRRKDIENMTRVTVRNGQRTRRGDFLMHPQWPPSFPAHRLNGLSSVDVPYSFNKR